MSGRPWETALLSVSHKRVSANGFHNSTMLATRPCPHLNRGRGAWLRCLPPSRRLTEGYQFARYRVAISGRCQGKVLLQVRLTASIIGSVLLFDALGKQTLRTALKVINAYALWSSRDMPRFSAPSLEKVFPYLEPVGSRQVLTSRCEKGNYTASDEIQSISFPNVPLE